MFVANLRDIERKQISGDGIKNVLKQVPIGPAQGWKDHVLRVFTIRPDGHTPKHSHHWEHINYVIAGEGILEIEGKPYRMDEGHFAIVPPNVEHQYSNNSQKDFIMICIVPVAGDY